MRGSEDEGEIREEETEDIRGDERLEEKNQMETVKRLIDVQIKEVEERKKSRRGVRTISNGGILNRPAVYPHNLY